MGRWGKSSVAPVVEMRGGKIVGAQLQPKPHSALMLLAFPGAELKQRSAFFFTGLKHAKQCF